jgi:hypothetical protein
MAETNRATAIIQEARICLLAGARIANSADPSDAMLVLLSGPLSELHGQLFEPSRLSELARKRFDWEISADAIEFFIPKMRALGWLESRSEFPARGPYFVNLPDPEEEGEEGEINTHVALQELGQQFKDFSQNLSPFQTLPEDPSEAGAALLSYVVDANLTAISIETKARSDEVFLAARFIEHVNKDLTPARDIIASLSAVGFLFRVAEEITHPTQKRKVDLRVVIDGPILLDYLGCSGQSRADIVKEIFEKLRSMGASTITFEHCVEEARDALGSVLSKQARDRYGPTGEALRKGIVNERALLGLQRGFEVAVRSAGIAVLPGDPEFMPSIHRFFDEERAKSVEQIVNWHDGANDDARFADSDTTVATIRRRAGHRTSDLFSSKFVCVTTNQIFAGATRRHLVDIKYYNERQIPPVISMKELAAKLWIESGNHDRASVTTLPNSQLLLSCDRALRFNRRVVDKAREELAKVKPDQLQQFELLLDVPRSARAVMDLSLNNENYVSGETIDQLLEAAIEAAGEEVGAKAKVLRAKDKAKFERELAEATAKTAAETQRADDFVRKVQEQARKVAESESNRIAADEAILEAMEASSTARFVRFRNMIRSFSLVAAMIPIGYLIDSLWNGEFNIIKIVGGLLTAGLAFATAMDKPGSWLSHFVQSRIASGVERQLRSIGRYDLAETAHVEWDSGVASVIRVPSGG